MSEKLDNWLIGVHQSVVNWLQKTPRWCVEKCAVLLMLSSVARFAMIQTPTPMNYVGLFIFVLLSMVLYFISNDMSDEELKYHGSPRYFRIIVFCLGVITLVGGLIFGEFSVLRYVVEIVYQVSFMSVYYFMVCEVSPPKEPKKNLSFV